ncbi:hypothetical protein [Bacterioplanoides sp.]|uniref:hypothetical protein n=1 Tax=Bacterioplanoides sp. TaxID=2066072 RepID=UPI003B5CC007
MRQPFTKAAKKIAVVSTVLILSACKTAPVKQGQPEWLLNPGDGVVASCGFHIKGHYAQQECAVQRARERLAARQGVEVSSISYLNTRVKNDRSSVSMDKETLEKVNRVTVKAKVKETWYDAQRDEYYVWMFAE